MYILCLKGKESEGAYAVSNGKNERTLLLFAQLEDAERFAILLDADDFPSMSPVEVDSESMIEMCDSTGYKYTVVAQDELIIPPSHNDHF